MSEGNSKLKHYGDFGHLHTVLKSHGERKRAKYKAERVEKIIAELPTTDVFLDKTLLVLLSVQNLPLWQVPEEYYRKIEELGELYTQKSSWFHEDIIKKLEEISSYGRALLIHNIVSGNVQMPAPAISSGNGLEMTMPYGKEAYTTSPEELFMYIQTWFKKELEYQLTKFGFDRFSVALTDGFNEPNNIGPQTGNYLAGKARQSAELIASHEVTQDKKELQKRAFLQSVAKFVATNDFIWLALQKHKETHGDLHWVEKLLSNS